MAPRVRRNADRTLSEGIRIFLSGGAHELPGEVLARVREAADSALWDDRHIPVPGGPIAPEGWIWIELKGASEELDYQGMPPQEVRRLVEDEGVENAADLFGDPECWGLEGPYKDFYVQFEVAELTGHFYYHAWVLVPREANWDRIGEPTEC